MMVILLGALLVFGGVLYMVRAVIWRGSLRARIPADRYAALWSRDGAAWDSWGSEQTGRAFSS